MSRLIVPLFSFFLLIAGGLIITDTMPVYADSHEAAESEVAPSTPSTRMSACLAGCQSGATYAQCVVYCGCMAQSLSRQVSVLDALGIGEQSMRGAEGFGSPRIRDSAIQQSINRCRGEMLQFAEEHQEQSPGGDQ